MNVTKMQEMKNPLIDRPPFDSTKVSKSPKSYMSFSSRSNDDDGDDLKFGVGFELRQSGNCRIITLNAHIPQSAEIYMLFGFVYEQRSDCPCLHTMQSRIFFEDFLGTFTLPE